MPYFFWISDIGYRIFDIGKRLLDKESGVITSSLPLVHA